MKDLTECLAFGIHRRFVSFLLIAVLTFGFGGQTSLRALAQSSCDAYAVAVAPQPAGHPLSDNVVRLVDGSGELTSVTFDQPRSVTPSPRDGVELLRSLGGLISLFDAATGTVTPVQIPEDKQPLLEATAPTIQNADSADFILLANIPNSVWLVDLRSGQAIDLTNLLPGAGFVESAGISFDGKWLQYFGNDTAYVISLETPGDPVRVSNVRTLRFPGFNGDRDALTYATTAEDGVTVWSFDPDSRTSSKLAASGQADGLDAVSSDSPLLIDGQSLLTLPAANVTPERFFSWQGSPLGIVGDRTGRYLAIGDNRKDAGIFWSWIDTETDTTIQLDTLTDMVPLFVSDRQDAVTFSPSAKPGPGTPGAPYRTLDLSTGEVTTVLAQDSTEVWAATAGGDDAGRYTLIDAVSPGVGRMWLIDAQTANSTEIGTSTGNLTAKVSPDGCQLAVAVFDTVGEGRTSVVTVTSLLDGSKIATIPDALLLGWATTPGAH